MFRRMKNVVPFLKVAFALQFLLPFATRRILPIMIIGGDCLLKNIE